MAESTHTPIPWFFEMPLIQLRDWIATANEVTREREEQMRQRKK